MTTTLTVPGPHPATLSGPALRKLCRVTFGRGSGPGGQHRNKVETEVRITHLPTGISAAAGERRSRIQNQHVAERRLREKLALGVRTAVDPGRYEPSELWQRRRQGTKLPVNPRNRDYPALLAEALDVVVAMSFDVGQAAGALGITMSQLARLIRHDRDAFAHVNEGRRKRGLAKLR
ncbi:MAG: peptide chain release factor family protein [Planctomycetota bacterium]|jgi:hypothetical protein